MKRLIYTALLTFGSFSANATVFQSLEKVQSGFESQYFQENFVKPCDTREDVSWCRMVSAGRVLVALSKRDFQGAEQILDHWDEAIAKFHFFPPCTDAGTSFVWPQDLQAGYSTGTIQLRYVIARGLDQPDIVDRAASAFACEAVASHGFFVPQATNDFIDGWLTREGIEQVFRQRNADPRKYDLDMFLKEVLAPMALMEVYLDVKTWKSTNEKDEYEAHVQLAELLTNAAEVSDEKGLAPAFSRVLYERAAFHKLMATYTIYYSRHYGE